MTFPRPNNVAHFAPKIYLRGKRGTSWRDKAGSTWGRWEILTGLTARSILAVYPPWQLARCSLHLALIHDDCYGR